MNWIKIKQSGHHLYSLLKLKIARGSMDDAFISQPGLAAWERDTHQRAALFQSRFGERSLQAHNCFVSVHWSKHSEPNLSDFFRNKEVGAGLSDSVPEGSL